MVRDEAFVKAKLIFLGLMDPHHIIITVRVSKVKKVGGGGGGRKKLAYKIYALVLGFLDKLLRRRKFCRYFDLQSD